jgi:hypothetical protein
MAMLIDDGRFRPCSAQRGARREDQLEVFVGLLVAQDALGDLEQAPRRISSETPSR